MLPSLSKLMHTTLLVTVLVIVGFAALVLFSDSESIISAVFGLSWELWAIILALSLGNYFLRFVRWAWYLSPYTPKELGYLKHCVMYLAGFAFTMTPGKAGEMLRCFYLNGQGVPNSKTMGAFVVERIVDLLTILLLALLVLNVFITDQAPLLFGAAVMLVIVATLVVLLPTETLIQSSLFRRLPTILQKLFRLLSDSLTSAREFLSPKGFFVGLSIGLVAWGLEGWGLFLLVDDYQPGLTTIEAAMGIYGFAMLMGALSFLPGGVGGAEAAMALLLAKIGFAMPEALAITLICRLATLWFAILLGVMSTLALSFLGLSPVEKKAVKNNV